MLRIAVLDDYARVAREMADWSVLGAGVEVFHDPIPPQELIARLKGFEVLCVMRERTPLPAEVLGALPDLRLIVTTGPRNLSIDTEAARAQGITVCGTRSRKTTTSELTMALMLALSRRLLPEVAAMAQGGWQGRPGRDLAELRLGVVGLGKIGQQVARLGQAFGMGVQAWSPNLTAERAAMAGVEMAPSLNALAARSDVLSVHMVHSARTDGLIGAGAFAALPDGAMVLNTSRAGLVVRDALFDGLRAGRPQLAGIDVFEQEPLAADDPWRAAQAEFGDRLLLTPHLGYVTQATWRLFYQDTVEAIAQWQKGTPIRLL